MLLNIALLVVKLELLLAEKFGLYKEADEEAGYGTNAYGRHNGKKLVPALLTSRTNSARRVDARKTSSIEVIGRRKVTIAPAKPPMTPGMPCKLRMPQVS